MKKNLMLIFGGISFEHEISCRSALCVYSIILGIPKYSVFPVYIDKNTGVWYLLDFIPENFSNMENSEVNIINLIPGRGIFLGDKNLKIDIIFPLIHGRTGEDGALQGLFKMMDIPYIGSGILGSALCMNKYFCKLVLQGFNIPLVPFLGFNHYDYILGKEEIQKNIKENLGFPVIVKPTALGSSIGIHIVYNEAQLEDSIKNAFKYDSMIIVEKFLEVKDIECSVIGNDKIKVFTLGEIVIKDFVFYDFEAKYNITPENSIIFNIPPLVENNFLLTIKEYAFIVYKRLGLRGYARIDFLLDENSKQVYLNEINTIPGFTDISLFAKMCEHDGLKHEALIEQLINYGLESYNNKKQQIDFKELDI